MGVDININVKLQEFNCRRGGTEAEDFSDAGLLGYYGRLLGHEGAGTVKVSFLLTASRRT